MKPLGLAGRLYTAEGLLACAFALSLAGLIWSAGRREASVSYSLNLTRQAQSVAAAAVSCRNYLTLVLHSHDISKADILGRQAAERLRRGRLEAWHAGSNEDSEDLHELSRFVGASRTLLNKIHRLELQGRPEESAALYRTGVRPLTEQYLASALDRHLQEEKARRAQALRRTRMWTQASLAAIAAFAACTFLLFALWTRRFANYLLRNIDGIRRGMAAIASGNLAIALHPERRDEMGSLATALNTMAAHLDQAQRRLVEAERLAAFGQLAGGAAHALNNPLSAMIGYASLLLEQDKWDPADRKDLQMILDAGRRCDLILRNLRQFASQKALVKGRTQVNEILQRMADFLRPTLESNSISLTLDLDPLLPTIEANAREIQQVFYNLIDNASRAVRAEPEARIEVSSRREGTWVCVTIEDNGKGIPPENLKRIFEPFFTTRVPEEGAGLGLSSALVIVKEHGGEIRVESQPGQWSRFEVRLPARAYQGAAGTPSQGTPGGRILAVDDEQNILALVERVLAKEGFQIECAADTRKALQAVETAGYDLILSDFCMPGMDGRGFYEEVRRRRPELAERFVFSTGEIVSKDFQAFTQRHGIPVLLKPFDLQELVRIVRDRISAPARAEGQRK